MVGDGGGVRFFLYHYKVLLGFCIVLPFFLAVLPDI